MPSGAGLRFVIALLFVITTTAFAARVLARTGGPLATETRTNTEFGLDDARVVTWGMPLDNQTAADIRIESIHLVDVSGLEIVGFGVYHPSDGGIGSAYGFPPPGIETQPVAGSMIESVRHGRPLLAMLVGVRLLPGAAVGSIAGFRIRYSSDDGSFDTVLKWSLTVARTTSPRSITVSTSFFEGSRL